MSAKPEPERKECNSDRVETEAAVGLDFSGLPNDSDSRCDAA